MNTCDSQDTQRSPPENADRVQWPDITPPAATRHVHHAREFGMGYGNSSGYGSALHFTDGHEDALFKFR